MRLRNNRQLHITMNDINTIAPVTSVERKRRQRLFRGINGNSGLQGSRLQLRSCV